MPLREYRQNLAASRRFCGITCDCLSCAPEALPGYELCSTQNRIQDPQRLHSHDRLESSPAKGPPRTDSAWHATGSCFQVHMCGTHNRACPKLARFISCAASLAETGRRWPIASRQSAVSERSTDPSIACSACQPVVGREGAWRNDRGYNSGKRGSRSSQSSLFCCRVGYGIASVEQ